MALYEYVTEEQLAGFDKYKVGFKDCGSMLAASIEQPVSVCMRARVCVHVCV